MVEIKGGETMNKKAIFEYCGWCNHKWEEGKSGCAKCGLSFYTFSHERPLHHLDSNDMTAAMNKMVEKGEWSEFFAYISFPYLREFDDESKNIHWLMQPKNFFKLMSEALEKGVIGK